MSMEDGSGSAGLALSPEAPCGPDLFAEGDSEFLNYTVRAEGLFPASFYSRVDGAPFSRTSADLRPEIEAGEALSRRTHDVRLLVILAKLYALDRDAAGAVGCLQRLSALLEHHWAEVHPRAEEGDFSYRMACLQAIDDNSNVVLPLHYCKVISHKRGTAISPRALLMQTGQVEPREGEEAQDRSAFDRMMSEVDLDALRAGRDLFVRLHDAVTKIRALWLERAGYDQAVKLDLLMGFAAKVRDAITPYVQEREGPVLAEGGSETEAGNSAVGAGAGDGTDANVSVRSFADAQHALAAAADFFARNEPSSPALPLIRQAQQLMGRSFLDVLRILAPEHVEAARLSIGRGPSYLQFPVERLGEFSALPEEAASETDAVPFAASNRREAVRLLGLVNAFYAANEPSSPLPLFTERASALAGRDFLGIIRDVLPPEALVAIERNLS